MPVLTLWGAETTRCRKVHAFVHEDALPVCGRGLRREAIVVPRFVAAERRCQRCLDFLPGRVRRREREVVLAPLLERLPQPPEPFLVTASIVSKGVLLSDETFQALVARLRPES